MIRVAVFAADDSFHRLFWRAAEEAADVQVELRFRAAAQIRPPLPIDVIVLYAPSQDLIAVASEAIETDVGMVVIGPPDSAHSVSAALVSRGGASGLLDGDAPVEQILSAVRAVDTGLTVSTPAPVGYSAVHRGPPGLSADESAPGDPRAGFQLSQPQLSPRELEVLVLLARGRTNGQIGEELAISENTVKYHLSALYGALDVHRRADAVLAALRQGLISL